MTDLMTPPVKALSGPSMMPGRHTWRDPFDMFEVVLDNHDFDFHIDAAPDHRPEWLRATLDIVEARGFEPMDDDECEPELLPNGWVRIYLVPIIPVEVEPLIPCQRTADTGSAGLTFLADMATLIMLPLAQAALSAVAA